jgi:mono/diheme cytochrome c family protein
MKLKIIFGLFLLCVAFIISCQSEDQLEFKRYYSSGSLIYQSNCQNCHGEKGEGLSTLIPPLTDSVFLKANRETLACIVKYGLSGKINLASKTYEGQMPANDAAAVHIAEVITYITNSFGNKMGTITTQQVNEDLNKCGQGNH